MQQTQTAHQRAKERTRDRLSATGEREEEKDDTCLSGSSWEIASNNWRFMSWRHGRSSSHLPKGANSKETQLRTLVRTHVPDDLIFTELLETITTVIRPSPEISLKNWPLHHVTWGCAHLLTGWLLKTTWNGFRNPFSFRNVTFLSEIEYLAGMSM